jgi:hypothetical protein
MINLSNQLCCQQPKSITSVPFCVYNLLSDAHFFFVFLFVMVHRMYLLFAFFFLLFFFCFLVFFFICCLCRHTYTHSLCIPFSHGTPQLIRITSGTNNDLLTCTYIHASIRLQECTSHSHSCASLDSAAAAFSPASSLDLGRTHVLAANMPWTCARPGEVQVGVKPRPLPRPRPPR